MPAKAREILDAFRIFRLIRSWPSAEIRRYFGGQIVIIWRGWGFLSVLIALAGLFGGALIGDLIDRTTRSGKSIAMGFVVAAVANWFIGRALNHSRREGGAGAFNRHSLFFMPMEWSSVLMLFGAMFYWSAFGH